MRYAPTLTALIAVPENTKGSMAPIKAPMTTSGWLRARADPRLDNFVPRRVAWALVIDVRSVILAWYLATSSTKAWKSSRDARAAEPIA